MRADRVKMPVQDPDVRNTNFCEVALGLDLEHAKMEASRCLDCKNPRCVAACPVTIDIPGFIQHIKEEQIEEAYHTIYQSNILPAICGRVCPQEKQCEGACILGIKSESVSIGALERFVGDYALEQKLQVKEEIEGQEERVAIIGSGPAGIACSASLRRLGYQVDVYEALHEFGGVLKYGIPDFRLPKDIVDKEIQNAKDLGVKFHKNVIVGKSITIEQLLQEMNYKSIFIGSGAGLPKSLGIPGENLTGIYFANEFLTRVNLMKANRFPEAPTPVRIGDNVAIVGGGNVAMDAARTAKRLGAKNVFVLYRRDMTALPARREEVEHAIEEHIDFRLLLNPVEFIGENYVLKQVRCEVMELGEPDESGRRSPVGTNTYKTFDIDSCVISIGQSPNPILKTATEGLETDKRGRIVVNNHQTSIPGVFAGGDVVSGAATVILAMGAGKEAAVEIDKYIRENRG
ncbi:MAG: NADPH-dependent glutamate synthase [Bacilli bacterium]|nr:NADPH-dependent glutamate synthase [Bacilli bacterium]MBN2876510.1 NADPH-dependent glutamate synthase [Bacilli bacterium]